MYDRGNRLVMIEVRMTKLANPVLGERGYSPFIVLYWDLQADVLTYNIRDGIRPMDWSEEDKLSFFQPDFMRRQWLLMPVRSYLGAARPEEFFLRPHLEGGRAGGTPVNLPAPLPRAGRTPCALCERKSMGLGQETLNDGGNQCKTMNANARLNRSVFQ
jgi:hypothetical protein